MNSLKVTFHTVESYINIPDQSDFIFHEVHECLTNVVSESVVEQDYGKSF